MSVIYQSNDCSLLDHRDFISKLYTNVAVTPKETSSYNITAKLFSIKSDTRIFSRKRKLDSDETESTVVKEIYERFLPKIPKEIKENIRKKYNLLDTTVVRDLARQFSETTMLGHNGIIGGNNSDKPLKCKIKDEYFLIPEKSRFRCGDVKEQCLKMEGTKFDIVIADPPWWNKYIRSLKKVNENLSYTMLYNKDIANIPLSNLFSDNCLVAVWCTNAPSNVNAVKELIFPAWGVEYLTTWYWLKVTVDLMPVCNFGLQLGKQPYERLVLGKVGNLNAVPETQLFMSVPSALHSHKPPLLDLLSPYVNVGNPQILELFARYLLPNTTSLGHEPLKWQHISLYDEEIVKKKEVKFNFL